MYNITVNRINEQDIESLIFDNTSYSIDKTKKEFILECLKNYDIDFKVDPTFNIFETKNGGRGLFKTPNLNSITKFNLKGKSTFLQCFDPKSEVALAKELESNFENPDINGQLLIATMNYQVISNNSAPCLQCAILNYNLNLKH